jgi:hypothetical protein
MQKSIKKYNLSTALVILAMMMVLPLTVSAKNAGAENSQAGNGTSNASTTSGSDNAVQKKLQGNSLESCQNREMAINNIMARVGDRGQKQVQLIDSIQEQVRTFYSNQDVTVSNYDKLVATVEAKKQTATQAMNTVRTMNGSFGCSKDDPKGIATQFKSQAASQSDSITEYKNAVHDLVEAIKTAIAEDAAATEVN